MEDIVILDCSSSGFSSLVNDKSWTVGIINYSEHLNASCLKKRERHFLSDELFIPVCGEGVLYIGAEMQKYKLKIGRAYLVKKGTWHAISVSEDAKVFVVENQGTGPDNSEYHYFNN